jgi:ferrous iron transport protein A
LQTTIDQLKINQKAIISDFDIDTIPLKLIEMGCLPGNKVELFVNINESFLAIRLETASQIRVELLQ